MKLLAKMQCVGAQSDPNSGMVVKLNVVTAEREENRTFSKYTPTGSLELVITNESALDFFVTGQEYLITMEKA